MKIIKNDIKYCESFETMNCLANVKKCEQI